MAADPTTAKNFLVSTDYPLDKIVYMVSGQLTMATGTNYDVSTPHNLSFTPLMKLSWSFSPTFDTSYNGGLQLYGDPSTCNVSIMSTATNYRILAGNNTGSTRTMYWRAYGFMPAGVTEDADFTSAAADRFEFNTGFNYMKLFDAGAVDHAVSGNNITITHNLGYIPNVDVWGEAAMLPGQYQDEYLGIANPGDTFSNRIYVTPTMLTFSKATSGTTQNKYQYRIYLDE